MILLSFFEGQKCLLVLFFLFRLAKTNFSRNQSKLCSVPKSWQVTRKNSIADKTQ